MTIELDLPPELEARLRAEAARLGITPEELAVRIIVAALDEMDKQEEHERIGSGLEPLIARKDREQAEADDDPQPPVTQTTAS